jgi:zinc protease
MKKSLVPAGPIKAHPAIFCLLLVIALTTAAQPQSGAGQGAGTVQRHQDPGLRPAVRETTAPPQQAPAPGRSRDGNPVGRGVAVGPRLQYEKYKLKNGLEVILSEDHRLPLVSVNVWYHVGPANEREGLTGFAHLFEHMMFQGSRNIDEPFKVLEATGATTINGTTDFDRTNYFETVPSNQLETALWLESDRMGFLLDKLDARQLENQRDVVRNERREGENRPDELVEEGMVHTLFPRTHPYYANVIGSHADIEAAELDDVRAFSRQFYTPNNASVAIVGDFDRSKIKQIVEKYFGDIPPGPAVPKVQALTPPITSERRKVVTDQVELPRVYMAWITDPIYKPGDAEADMLAEILGGGKSSRLYKKLVYEKQIAQSVTAKQESLTLGSVFEISATARTGVKLEELESAIDEELDAMRKSGPTAEEMERARNTIEASIIRGLETLGGFGGVADRLNQYNHFLGDPGYLAQDLARYQRASAAAVQKVAEEELARNRRVVVYGVPGEKVIEDAPKRTAQAADAKDAATAEASGEASAKQASAKQASAKQASAKGNDAWRATPPTPGAIPKFTLPTAKKIVLPNGLTMLLVERHGLPVVSANVVLLSGGDANPLNKPGLASFTADMLDEGTGKRTAPQLADDIAKIGAMISSGSGSDSSTVTMRVLKKNVDAAFELLADVALNPSFTPEELERVRKQRLVQLLQMRDSPGQLATRVFQRVVFGSQHPYGFIDIGTEDSNKAITRQDLQEFWRSKYVPGNAALVVAGDLTESELRALAAKYFGKWQGSRPRSTLMACGGCTAGRRHIVLVDKPGAPQTQLRIGQIGLERKNPDYVPVDVMNAALGGNFSSRINMNLREEHGYTYGAFSVFAFRRVPGPFFIGAGIRTDATAPAVGEVFKELDRMRKEPLSAQELSLAKDSISRSLPGLFETSASTAATIGNLFVYDLPLDYYRDLPSRVDAVDTAQVLKMADKYLTPESMVIVAVGDRSRIEPELKKLELGESEVRDFEGNVSK